MALLWISWILCVCVRMHVQGGVQQPHPNSDIGIDVLFN